MASKFTIRDKVDQAFSKHARGTVVAVLMDRAGECRYAVEMFGHRTIRIASESSLVFAPITPSELPPELKGPEHQPDGQP